MGVRWWRWAPEVALAVLLAEPVWAQTAVSFEALSAKANAARAADRLDEAVALYRKAVALKPKWTEGWWALGTIQYERSEYRAAAEAFRQVVGLSPKAGTPRAMLGLCEFELGQDASALRDIQEGRKIGIADDPQLRNVVLYHEGLLLDRLGSFRAARRVLRSLCWAGVQSNDVIRTLGLAALQIRDKDYRAAAADAEVVAQTGRADCLAGQKKNDEAREAYESLVREHSDFPNVHYAYGWFLLDTYKLEAGLSELRQEIKNQPNHVMARIEIAAALYKVDSKAGLPYAEEAVKLDPGLPLAHYYLGLLLLDTDDYVRAIPELEMVQKAHPGEAKLYLALGSAYSRAGREEDAVRARTTFQKLQSEQRQEELAPASGGQVDVAPKPTSAVPPQP